MAQTTTTAETQPSSDARVSAHHRKIDLQSHADLKYLQQNLAKSARAKLDLHFPPLAVQRATAPADVITLGGGPESAQTSAPEQDADEEEDPMRARVRMLVDEFLQNTYQSASHSISVNGIDATALASSSQPTCTNPEPSTDNKNQTLDPEQEVEGIHYTYAAFDPQLQKRLASLHGELETLTAQVSKLRREAPKNAADAYRARLEAALAEDDKAWESQQQELQDAMHDGLELQPLRDGWHEDVRDIYARGVNDLAVLSGVAQKSDGAQDIASLTETVGKARRAANAAQEFE